MKWAIISDIHEDVVNLKLALKKIEKKGCDEIICLGDISGFSVPHYSYYDTRNAHECLKIVRENCKIIIAGNHDLQASGCFPVFSPRFDYPGNWYSMDYMERKSLSKDIVWLYDHDELNPLYSKEDIEYLKTLPQMEIFEMKGKKLMFTHYIYPNMAGDLKSFYHHEDDFSDHMDFMAKENVFLSFAGHYHSPGLVIVAKDKLLSKSYGFKYIPSETSIILVPAIAGNKINNGFCIFDSAAFKIKAIRIH